MNPKKILSIIASATLLTLSCMSAAQAETTIKIGFINPATGVFSVLGESARMGLGLAIERARHNPAFKSINFVVEERDSAAKAADAIRYSRELIQRERVDVLMGGLSSAVCLAMQKLAAEEQIVYVNASGCWVDEFTSPENKNKYSFRVSASNEQRNITFAKWLVDNVGKRWYVAYSDYAYGQSGFRAFKDALASAGGEIAGSIGVPFGSTDMAAYMSKVDRSADGLYFVFAGRDAILALQEANAQGLKEKMKFAGMQSLIVPENFPKLPEAAEGLNFIGDYPRAANGPLDTAENREFQKLFHEKFGERPVGLNAFEAYQSANALLLAIEKSGFKGRADTDKLAAAMSGLEAPASVSFPAGSITIRAADHQGVVPLYIGHVEGGSERVTHQITAKEIGAIK
jgi:branched-chain amino acid transport system substrate-binding protein